ASCDLAPRETADHGADQQQPALRAPPGEGHQTVTARTTVAVSGEPLAEQLGEGAVVNAGRRVAEEFGGDAGARNVSETIVGDPPRSGWWVRWRPSVVASRVQPTRSLGNYALAATLVAVAGLAAASVMAVLPLRDPRMLFLAAVLLSAVGGGLHASIFASVLSVLVYDFFFTEPFHSLRMTDPQDYLSLGAFLIVAVLTSHLTARVRDQAAAARRREARTAALYAFGRAITGAATIDDLCHAIVTHVAQTLDAAAAVLLPDAGQLTGRAAHPADVQLDASEWATATWAWEHDQPA